MSPILKGAQVVNKNIMDEAINKVLSVLKPLPISLVRNLVNVYELKNNMNVNWVFAVFTFIVIIFKSIKIIIELRDEIITIPEDISEDYKEILIKKVKSD